LGSKRLEILHTLVPKAKAIGILVNPNYDAAVSFSAQGVPGGLIGVFPIAGPISLLFFSNAACRAMPGVKRSKCPAPEQTFGANARNQTCESNEADRYQMVAPPPLMHRKGHAGPRDQQRHQNDHAIYEL
jgi:hypothetical protein